MPEQVRHDVYVLGQQILHIRMPLDIRRDERALCHDLQTAVPCAVERAADQLARHAAPLDRLGHQRMGEDDRVALQLIGGEGTVPVDHQFEFMFGLVVAYDIHPWRLHRMKPRVQ